MGAVAIASAVTQGIGVGVSFAQANKQKQLELDANAAAAKAMIEQKNLLETNFAEQVQVPLEGYQLAAQANAAIQGQNISALSEAGDRALMGGVGRTMAVGANANEEMRMQMQQDLYNRNKLIAAEDNQIRNDKRDVELGIVKGAQQAAAQAEMQRQQYLMQGVQGLGSMAATGLNATGLYAGGGLGLGKEQTSTPVNTPIVQQPNLGNTWYPGGVMPDYGTNPNQINAGTQVNEYNSGLDYMWNPFNTGG